MHFSDLRRLEAAQGWVGLGNWREANEELENITPENRAHPEVLCIRWQIYCMAEKWERANEIARVISERMLTHMACWLHKKKRTEGAWRLLLGVADKFPDNHSMRYNLACYASQLGNFEDARKWLEQ